MLSSNFMRRSIWIFMLSTLVYPIVAFGEPFRRPFSVYLNPIDAIPERETDEIGRSRFIVRETATPEVKTIYPDGCSRNTETTCMDQLMGCILQVAMDHGATCQCFMEHGRCYRDNGCPFSVMPKTTLNWCHFEVQCTLDECEGNGSRNRVQMVYLWTIMIMLGVIINIGIFPHS